MPRGKRKGTKLSPVSNKQESESQEKPIRRRRRFVTVPVPEETAEPKLLFPERIYVAYTIHGEKVYIRANQFMVDQDRTTHFFMVYGKDLQNTCSQSIGVVLDVTKVVTECDPKKTDIEEEMKKFEQGFAYRPPECKAALQEDPTEHL